jgi:hypothetical protein
MAANKWKTTRTVTFYVAWKEAAMDGKHIHGVTDATFGNWLSSGVVRCYGAWKNCVMKGKCLDSSIQDALLVHSRRVQAGVLRFYRVWNESAQFCHDFILLFDASLSNLVQLGLMRCYATWKNHMITGQRMDLLLEEVLFEQVRWMQRALVKGYGV